MSSEWIELADGTAVDDAYVVKLDNNNIAVYVKGTHSFSEMCGWFCDSSKTTHMMSDQYGDVNMWDGFTEPVTVQINDDNAYVCLRKS